ncbi:class I SAM-dependent methyltransferase [Peribacillus sp. SI8-4]|uniref:class I SAM-dependent methyltransferase n=1 Tax=Peribacillus sp. SI8-4 TaxID=3048009 RepID=UPI00255785AE|nr:class I SAM-dependent methyltransferase [Peribacillus sp. SI8-4]
MFVTTVGKADEETAVLAKRVAEELQVRYIARKKRSVHDIQIENGQEDCLVYGKKRMELYRYSEKEPFFFHPNLAMIRMKRLIRGESDPFLMAGDIKGGSSVLDCTLGLGSDAIVASFAVGAEGRIVALEGNPYLALLVKHGLKTWCDAEEKMIEAMRSIEVIHADHYEMLKAMPDNHFDVVYFDPMFEETINESHGIKGLTHFAEGKGLSMDIIGQAKRVARKRVVLKDHFRSTRFEEFDFNVQKRKTAKFHFGYISIS